MWGGDNEQWVYALYNSYGILNNRNLDMDFVNRGKLGSQEIQIVWVSDKRCNAQYIVDSRGTKTTIMS